LDKDLSQGSIALFNHTNRLANSNVSSDDVKSSNDMSSLSEDIRKESKREIRQSRIYQREKEKTAIATEIKSQIQHQTEVQSFSTLLQVYGMKLMEKLCNDSTEKQFETSVAEQGKKIDALEVRFDSMDNKISRVLELLDHS